MTKNWLKFGNLALDRALIYFILFWSSLFYFYLSINALICASLVFSNHPHSEYDSNLRIHKSYINKVPIARASQFCLALQLSWCCCQSNSAKSASEMRWMKWILWFVDVYFHLDRRAVTYIQNCYLPLLNVGAYFIHLLFVPFSLVLIKEICT